MDIYLYIFKVGNFKCLVAAESKSEAAQLLSVEYHPKKFTEAECISVHSIGEIIEI